ncbi:MAG TPA: sialidase family protein [Gammaproteobacteria bacterium]|nr:sialidase family protein [Gammaproteobacteria bacterium]
MKPKVVSLSLLLTGLLAACGGGGSSSSTSGAAAAGTISLPAAALVRVSQSSPYPVGCGGGSGVYEDAEVEPYMAINPANPSNIIGSWQQDRFPDGGAHGLVVGSSTDGGKHWNEHILPFSVCGGGNSTNGGDYSRASDPWVTFAQDGSVAYVISISFSGNTLQAGSNGAVLVSRSLDGGASWSNPVALITDGASAFNDKESITADPVDPKTVYAVWDRLTTTDHGAAMFARSSDRGQTWTPATAIYDPGVGNQTLGNEIVGMPDGTILDLFEEIDGTSSNNATSTVRIISSSDQGTTWSSPVTVADNLAVGASDPNTGTPIRSGSGLPQMAAGPGKQLAVVWEDGRFSNGNHDGIAYSASTDDGQHWSAPVQINSAHAAPAFTPSVAILGDGTVGVSYFDFRKNTAGNGGNGTLATDYWFTSSTDGVHWSEQHITGSFDMQLAPNAEGLFVGDYEALGKLSGVFVPFFVQTNGADTSNRTDSYYLPPQPTPLRVTRRVTQVARMAQTPAPDAAFRRRVHENLMRVLKDEDPVWDQIREARRQPGMQPP